MRCPPPPGRKTAMKFDVEKIFQETRRTAREYSQQTSGGRRSIPLSTSLGVGGVTHFIHSCSLFVSCVSSFVLSEAETGGGRGWCGGWRK